jgi:hypothetical protein
MQPAVEHPANPWTGPKILRELLPSRVWNVVFAGYGLHESAVCAAARDTSA